MRAKNRCGDFSPTSIITRAFCRTLPKAVSWLQEGEKQVVEQEGCIQILFWSYKMHVKQRVWEDIPSHMHFTAIEGDFDVLQGDFYLTTPTALERKTRLTCEFVVKPKKRVPDWAVRMAAKHYLKKMVSVIADKAEKVNQ